MMLSRLRLRPRCSNAISAETCEDPPNRAVPSFLHSRSAALLMLGWVTNVKGYVLRTPKNIMIVSPPAIKLTSAAGAPAAISISPASSIWATSEPPPTKINWTSSPYLSKIFLSFASHNGVLCGVAVETATRSRVLVVCAWQGQAAMRMARTKRTMTGLDFLSNLSLLRYICSVEPIITSRCNITSLSQAACMRQQNILASLLYISLIVFSLDADLYEPSNR